MCEFYLSGENAVNPRHSQRPGQQLRGWKKKIARANVVNDGRRGRTLLRARMYQQLR